MAVFARLNSLAQKIQKKGFGWLYERIKYELVRPNFAITRYMLGQIESLRKLYQRNNDAPLNKMVPEDQPYYRHTMEGSDDMPAHLKSSILGSSIQVPITEGSLNLGIWQGIYLCEHRNHGGSRKLLLTAWGEN